MISPLLLRSSLCVSFFISSSVARVLHWNLVQHETLANPRGQAPSSIARQDAEQGAAGWNPGEGPLEHADGEAAIEQVANGEGGERAVGGEVGAQQSPTWADTRLSERRLEQRRRQMQDRNRVADQRQRRAHPIKAVGVVGDDQVTGLPPRSSPQPRQVCGEPLLQLSRAR